MGNFKVCTTFNKSLGQTAPSAWKCLKTQFWGPLATAKNSLSHWKARIWLPVAFKKNSWHTHKNPLKPSQVSERSAYPLQNCVCFSPLTSGLEVLGTNLLPLTVPGLRSTVPKGQLSRVPWPGNSWMPFPFQPALWTPQQPHKHSNSLQQAIQSPLAHHYIK